MKPKYIDIGKPEDRLIEECAELTLAIQKAKRFGLNNFHPDSYPCRQRPPHEWCDFDKSIGKVHIGGFMGHTCGTPKTNLQCIKDEFFDVIYAYSDYMKEIERNA